MEEWGTGGRGHTEKHGLLPSEPPFAAVVLSLSVSNLGSTPGSVSEIEFCTLYVVAERWILGCMLRFVDAKNDFSDTLPVCPGFPLDLTSSSFETPRYGMIANP